MKLIKIENLKIILFITVLALMILSIAIVNSASASFSEVLTPGKNPHQLASNHAVKVLFACIVLVIFSKIPYKVYKNLTHLGILISILLLFLTLFFGTMKKGAVRSFDFGFIEIQTSFLALYAMIFHFANLIERKGERVQEFKTGYLPFLVCITIIALLVFLQPNFSQGIMIILIGLSLVFLGGASLRHLFFTALAAAPIILIYMFSAEYRLQRIGNYVKRLFNPSLVDPDPQVRYAIYAIGSGGTIGVGFGNSNFRELFIPEAYGDFIFSIIGEELGFVGSIFILFLYLVIMIIGYIVMQRAEDVFGKIISAGVVITIGFYLFANTLVVVGILPTTGLPLPLLSYGGSALVMHSIGLGMLINIASTIKSVPERSTDISINLRNEI